jgi:hypothetical protein
MLRRIYGQLPEFARPGHPVMRYMRLREGRRTTRGMQFLRLGLIFGLLTLLVVVGYFITTQFGRAPIVTANPLDGVYLILYWPLVILQFLVHVFALNTTVGVISTEIRAGTWDTLKITTDGALLTMKARWATAFYRLWLLLAVLVIVRVLFIGIALIDLSSFQGRYLDLLMSGTTPFGPPNVPEDTAVIIGVLIVAMMMTGALLAPFTAVALDAALGMLIGTFSRGRMLGTFGQVGVVFVRLLLTAWALWVGAAALSLTPFTAVAQAFAPGEAAPLSGWLGAFFGVAEGDMGLTLLHLPHEHNAYLPEGAQHTPA